MNIFAIADLHLAFGVPQKRMGNKWEVWLNHEEKLYQNFHKHVQPDDIVLIAGDISWAMNLEEAKADFDFINQLPGKKIFLKGNHDYWWPSDKKLKEFLSSNDTFINKNFLNFEQFCVGGARLWENQEIISESIIDFSPGTKPELKPYTEHDLKTFLNEYERLEKSLMGLEENKIKIAMTHYPPIEPFLSGSRFTDLFEKYKIQHVVFGHIHNAKKMALYGERNGVQYHLVAADYLDFCPKKIIDID